MGYIKKLKNNELVGGTDKTTIYPVTSAEAVFEEVSDGEFKSQKYLNNNITNERIVDNTIENQKLKDDTIDMGKLNTQLKTIIQNAYDASWKVKKEPFSLETKYDANDVVYDPDTNSSYVSLTADNQGNPVNPEDERYVEGKWRIIINGISAVESTEVINAKVTELEEQVDGKIDDAQDQLDQMIADAAASLADAESDARGAAAEASAVVANKVADAQIGYFECNTATGTALKQTTLDYIGTGDDKSYYTIPAAGSNVKIKMQYANTATGTIELQFGSNTATRKQLIYNGEPASNSNSWDDGEVISIYYDPTYNNNTGAYQASNAQGGGGRGIKVITPTSTNRYIALSGDTIGAVSGTGPYRYVKMSVNPGDVILISGAGSTAARLWAFANSTNNDTIVSRADENVTKENLVLVAPENADTLCINNINNTYSNPIWLYAKAGSDSAETLKNTGYLVYDIPKIALGTEYAVGTVVKTEYNQKKKINQLVSSINTTTTISEGEYKTDGTNTYKAVNAIGAYDTETSYTDGSIAIGYPTTLALQISVSTLSAGNIVVTFGSNTATISIDGTEVDASGVATKVLAALVSASIEGWSFSLDSQDNSKIVATCGSVGDNSATTFSIADADEEVVTGVSGEKEIVWNGSRFAVKYDATTDTWVTASIADIATFIGGTIDSLSTLVNEITIYDSLDNEVIREKIISYTKVEAHYYSSKFVQASSTSNNFGKETSVGNSDYSATGFIPCKGATEVRSVYSMFSNSAKYCGLVFYDENYIPILSRVNTSTKAVAYYTNKVPVNACYFRTTIYTLVSSTASIADVYYREHIVDTVNALDTQLSSVEQRVSNTEKEISEINPYLENSELVDYSTLKTASHTAYVTMTVDVVNNSVRFYCITIGAGKRGALYLPDNMINGRQYIIEFDYESQSSKAVWFAISNGYTANTLTYYYGRQLYSYGHSKFVIDYNSSIHKLFVVASNDITAGKSLILTNLSIRQLKSFDVVNDRLDKLETPSTGIKIVGNGINVVTLTPSFSLEDYMTPSINAGQGGAVFGDYYFVGTTSGYLYIYNLASKTYIERIALPAFPISTTHVNTMCFSNQYYAQGDAFPLLYISSGYTQDGASQVYGCRIVNENDIRSISIVHTITLANSGWSEYVLDTANNKAWIKTLNNWYSIDEPQLSDSEAVTIDIATLTPIFHVKSYGGSAQGHLFLNGKIYFPSGKGTAEGISRLYVLDTNTGEFSSIINLYEINREEPENVFTYNGRLYIGYRNAIRELKCLFYSDVPNIV